MTTSIEKLGPDTLLPDLFRAHPEARAIFNRYGLRGCGGDHGPAESVAFFAGAHGVALEPLLAEIDRVVRDPVAREAARTQLAEDARPRLADAIYRPFFLAGLGMILTVGAAWGVLLLWKISLAGSFTGVTTQEVNAHGHAQIMGWVGLFIMGFAYQAFPRMWQVDLPAPRLALLVWLAMLIGIAARSSAMMATQELWARPLHHVGTGLEIGAVAIFAWQLATAFARSGKPLEPYAGFALASVGFFLLQTVYSGWHIARIMTAPSREAMLAQIATFQAPLRDLQIHGMALLMILGVGIRMFPIIFGLPETPRRRGWLALGLLLVAIGLEVGLLLAYRLTGRQAAAYALLVPWLLLPLGAGLIVGPWRLWRPLPEPGRSDRSGKFLRAAFAWLFVSFAMLGLLPVYQAASESEFSHAYYGAIRHAITVGFISMMIVGMAAKVVPTLRGLEPGQLPALWPTFVLLNVGCLWRVSSQVLTDWVPSVFLLTGVSGLLEWTALALWAGHLGAVMLGWGRYRQSAAADWGPPPERLGPEHRVAAVLAWHPELEPVFVEHGFELIRNPVLRRTVARQASLQQVCRMKGVGLQRFLEVLERSRRPRETGGCSQPIAEINLTLGGMGGAAAETSDHSPPAQRGHAPCRRSVDPKRPTRSNP